MKAKVRFLLVNCDNSNEYIIWCTALNLYASASCTRLYIKTFFTLKPYFYILFKNSSPRHSQLLCKVIEVLEIYISLTVHFYDLNILCRLGQSRRLFHIEAFFLYVIGSFE